MDTKPDQNKCALLEQRIKQLKRLLDRSDTNAVDVDRVHAELKMILEATGEKLLLIDVEKNIIAANSHATDYLGRNPDAVVGKNLDELIPDRTAGTRSRFLERMSHELRSPLNSILGYAQLLELEYENKKIPQLSHVSEIIEASERLLQMVTDLMDLAKIESNALALSMGHVNLGEVIESCIAAVKSIADARRIKINYGSEQCMNKWVHADPTRLKQVFFKLLSNAIHFSRDGSSIDLSCKKTWGNRLRVSLVDAGPGISEVDCRNIFNPFHSHYLDSYSAEGLDIGLTLSKSLVEQMHGHMGVESEHGMGSTFWIELGLAGVHPEMPEHKNNFDNAYGSSVRSTLLYVEDSPTHMRLVEDIVETMPDIRFIGADTPMLGLELARTHRPDVILLDICLPDMDGCEFFKYLQRQKASRHIPVVGLSANALSEEIEKGLQLGFSGYLTKPINIQEFKHVIKGVLKKYESR